MFKKRQALVLTLTLVAALSIILSGCGGDSPAATTTPAVTTTNSGQPAANTNNPASTTSITTTAAPQNNLTAQEIALNCFNTTEKMTTLKFDMNMSMSFGMPMGGKTSTMSMQETGTGSINLPNKEMALVMNMIMSVPEQGEQNMDAEIYSTGGWMYMKANVPGMGAQWTKMKLTDELWAQQSRMSSMTDFLNSPVGVEVTGSETIRGVDCYVLSVTPNAESLSDWMSEQTQSGQGSVNMGSQDMSEYLKNFSIKIWVAKNNNLIAQQHVTLKTDTDSTATSSSIDQMNMNMDVLLTYYDYGKSVTIQLPAEALNAQEIATGQP